MLGPGSQLLHGKESDETLRAAVTRNALLPRAERLDQGLRIRIHIIYDIYASLRGQTIFFLREVRLDAK